MKKNLILILFEKILIMSNFVLKNYQKISIYLYYSLTIIIQINLGLILLKILF